MTNVLGYGSDENADLNVATQKARVEHLAPFDDSRVSQWTYPDNEFVQHIGSRKNNVSALIIMEKT